jgi:hypothetical protein
VSRLPGLVRSLDAGEFGSWRHLAARFFDALSPAGPPRSDEEWVAGQLLPGEQALWQRMPGRDRRHAVAVARETLRLLGDGGPAPRPVVAAALLHDVGKIESGFGPFGRVAVTLAAIAVGRARLVAPPASRSGRLRRRVRLYLTHDRLGGALLRRAGADPLTVTWAEQHHQPPERWTVDQRFGAALKTADGD